MSIRHAYTQTVADGTATSVVRPSDWNSAHVLVQNLVGNTLGTSQVSGQDIYWAGGNNVTLSANGSTISINAGAGGGGGVANSAGTQIATSGTVIFSNSNGVTFGMSNSSVITASVSQSVQTQASGNIAGIGFSTTSTAGVVIVGTNSTNGLSLGVPNFLTTQSVQTQASGAIGGTGFTSTSTAGSNITAALGTNGLTFAVPNYLTTYAGQTNQTVASGNIAGTGFTSTTTAGANVVATLNTAGLSMAVPLYLTTSNQSVQTQASGGIAGTNTSFGGTNISGSLTLNSSGLTVSVSGLAPTINQTGPNIADGNGNTITSGTVVFSNSNGISFGLNGSTMTAGSAMMSYYEPKMRGQTTTATLANGTVYFQPFVVEHNLSLYRLNVLQQATSQSATTFSLSASVSAGNASSGSGSYGVLGTVLLYSRVSTGTNINSSQIVSFASNTYSYGVGIYQSASWSTNVSSATASYTTSGQISFITSIGSNGAVTTTSTGTSGSSTFTSTSTNANSFSTSFSNSFASQFLSGVRPFYVPMATSMGPGEYWMAHIRSTNTGTTNAAGLSGIPVQNAGIIAYTTNTSGFLEIGATQSVVSSNVVQGWGSYSSSGNTTTTIALSAISQMSNYQTWFNAMAEIK